MADLRLEGKVAAVAGGGQTPGETIGNGRASALRFAAEGARILVVDRDAASAAKTVEMIEAQGGEASALQADVTVEGDCARIPAVCVERYGRIDILHNNVGRSQGDANTLELSEENWRALLDINLKSCFLTSKHALKVMREQHAGVIINISSTASLCSQRTLAYKIAKSGINSMTQMMAIENAAYGIRVNAILPGLMDTPMAIERRVAERGVDREVVRQERAAQVPLLAQQGSAWDVANAALFLASDEARYITGVLLPVDGGLTAKVG